MSSAPDCRRIAEFVDEAMAAGARRALACAELGLHPHTLGRWRDPEDGIRLASAMMMSAVSASSPARPIGTLRCVDRCCVRPHVFFTGPVLPDQSVS
ncbi:hypothetical protein [Poseidonocella sp. HB161398]|uniref:hypothetical protein n=1 Tax=Poseidonocella sp. HB161398 TaxID=2320855 RepID=UPI001486DDC4|nr:hypothetical protein [Poseidonocella sp. HB161398]